jgi:hypothetical protein
MRNRTLAAALAVVVSATIAQAQIAQAQERPAPPAASPAPRNDCPAGPDNPRTPGNETTGSRPLSDRLSQSKGVICPPAGIDPGIAVPPVSGGRMPVIPPPGTPGGDPSIEPK